MAMTWAEEKALSALMAYGPHSAELRAIVTRAIRETIEQCAEAAEESRVAAGFRCPATAGPADAIGYAVGSAARAIRKLGEP